MAKRPKRPKRTKQPNGKKRGPPPDTLVIEGEWVGAMRRALAKKRPKRGWPKHRK